MHVSVKSHRPEDAELLKKLEELAGLQTRLADLEFQLFNLLLELSDFETAYRGRVGQIYADLDEIEALIAEKIAKKMPQDGKAAEAAGNARRQAEESRKEAAALSVTSQPVRSGSLRDLYRTAAKHLHPDLSRDAADRELRERLMAEANLAYAQGDEDRLRAVIEEYNSSPDTVVGTDVAADLVRAIRRISLGSKRIEQIESEIVGLKESELFKLKAIVANGALEGKDVLGEMVERLSRQLQVRRMHLGSL